MLPIFVSAQDARFSQYFNNPMILNPALTGNGIEHIRITAIYRNQWAGMGTPFTTQGFAVDKVVNRIGLGAAITRNGAGEASIRTINFVGNLSYNLPLDGEKKNVLSAGMQVGIVNKSFDPSKLTFDNQYNPDAGYDPNIASGEEFVSTNVTRPDVNAGLMWQRGWLNKEVRFRPFLGLALSHLTQPDETFITEITKVHMKRTVYGGAGYMLNDYLEIKPSFMLLNQGPNKESTFGTLINYQLDNKNSVQLGAYHRLEDAVIAYAGYQMNLLFVGMSYDVNTSELSKSGKGNNAFEISLTYSPRSKRKKEIKEPKKAEPRAETISAMTPLEATFSTATVPDVLADRNNDMIQTTQAPETVVPEPEIPVVADPVEEKIVAPIPEITNTAQDFDEDGVADNNDDCPFIKGTASAHGCPDSDNDGIIDLKDNCPMESGTLNNNGCPEAATPSSGNQELVRKYDNILFATGLVKMTTDDIFDIIERAIDQLYADKTTKVILSGHTDSEGNEYQNMILSQARADVVKRYMIEQGIDPARIQTIAYGETMPLQNNLTGEGRRLNRRVEINILRK
jgi:type IX secretion system PorP/SprF family membrane protein